MGIVWNGRRFLGGVLGNKAGTETPSRAIGGGLKAAIDFIQGRGSLERFERAEDSRSSDASGEFDGHCPD